MDADAHILEVYALREDGHWLLHDTLKDDDAVRQPPFEAAQFSLVNLWA